MKRVFLLKKLNTTEESPLNKRELRKIFLERVKEIDRGRKKSASKEACAQLLELSKNKALVASFAPLETEIDIWDFNHEMIRQKKLALPKVSGKDLIFYPVNSLEDLKPSNWKVLEPIDTGHAIQVGDISFFVVPGLAFDANKNRLGKGKGFYDYFISLHGVENTLGIGYKEQYSNALLPFELHDKPLKEVLLF